MLYNMTSNRYYPALDTIASWIHILEPRPTLEWRDFDHT